MASIVQIEMPDSVKKAQESLDYFADFGIGSGTKAVADRVLDTAEAKTKAMVDMLIETVENQVADMLERGIGNMYSAMNINEETIGMARSVIKAADTATSLLSSGIMKGLLELNNFDTMNLPMSAMVAGLNIISSLADTLYKKFIEKYSEYVSLAVEVVVNPGSVVEALLDTLRQVIQRIYDLIDEQVFLYTGYRIPEIRYMCTQGYNYYKRWKQLRRQQRRAGEEDKNTHVSVEVSPAVMKENMKEWLKKQNDALYNSFMILQIMDAIDSVRNTVAALTSVSLETLADDMNSLDDLVSLLDELGLGDDSTSVDLSMIPSLNINSILASFNSMKGNAARMADTAAMTAMAAFNSGVSVTATSSSTKTYEISSDHATKTIKLDIYRDPTRESMSRDIYRILVDTKDADGKKLFTLAECKSIQESITALYRNSKASGKGTLSLPAGGFTVEISLDVTEDGKKTTETKSYGNTHLREDEAALEEMKKREEDALRTYRVELDTVKGDDWESEEESRSGSRRHTIALLHMCYSLLKSIFPILTNLAALINNYKINRAYAAGKSRDNLFTLFKNTMAKLGLDKHIDMNASVGERGRAAYLYTVRTYALYMHLQEKDIVSSDTSVTTFSLDDSMIDETNIWLAAHEPESEPVPDDKTITLYVDYASIADEKRCLEEQEEILSKTVSPELVASFVKKCTSHRNGTFDALENVEISDGNILYSDKNLPRMPSQIMSAMSRKCNPF